MDDNEDNLDAPLPSLHRLANIGHAFAIPCGPQIPPLLRGFESSAIMKQTGPWQPSSPFDEGEAAVCAMVYEASGTSGMYREANSSQSQSSSEHLSFGGSVSIGPPFLEGEVSGRYDKTVLSNRNGAQSSRNGSYHLGRVILEQFPPYSKSARQLLGSADGQAQFRKRYGEYFVRGYTLGANAGVCVAAQFDSSASREELQVKLTAKVLGWSKSVEHRESSASASVSASLQFCGYSTLQNKSEALDTNSASPAEQARIGEVAAAYTKMVSRLESDARKSMRDLKLKEGVRLSALQVFDLCRSGLVIQLLLFPHALTQDYINGISPGGL